MSKHKSSSNSAGAGLLIAITASLCCITPVLALVSGASGVAASFSWMEPFRPYLIGITVLVLAFAWYQNLKPKKEEIDCECEEDDKKSFMQSKLFLGLVTVFSIVMLAFPYYSHVFYPDVNKNNIVINESSINEVSLSIEGMTCTGCEEHINHEVNKLNGVSTATASYIEGQAVIKYDPTKTSEQEIIKAIKDTGYKVVEDSRGSQGN